MTKPTAPIFRSLDQLSGDKARSGVTAVLAAADAITNDLARLERDNWMLTRQLDALLETDRGELLTRNEELDAELNDVRGLLADKVGECAEMRRERDMWQQRALAACQCGVTS